MWSENRELLIRGARALEDLGGGSSSHHDGSWGAPTLSSLPLGGSVPRQRLFLFSDIGRTVRSTAADVDVF